MDIKKPDRSTLKSYFVKNAIPTAGNFADLIEGMINQKEDGIAKLAGEPVSVQADGDDNGQKKAINFYRNFADPKPAWTLALNPRANPGDATTGRTGFSVSDADGNSRLFIDQSTGNLGVGTVNPGPYKLSVVGRALVSGDNLHVLAENAGRLRVGAAWGMPGLFSGDDGAKPLMLGVPVGQKVFLGVAAGDAFVEGGSGNAYFKGNIGIGTTTPSHKFHVVAADAVGLFESSGGQAFLRLSTNEGIGNRVEITNRPGGRLSLWTAGGGDVFNITKDGNVGIGTTAPAARLEVAGAAIVSNGAHYATRMGYMTSGSLTIGGTNTNYGGGKSWNANTAALLLETQDNTEIAVHDGDVRLTSLMFYEGGLKLNRITIGRDMGWGPVGQVAINGDVSLSGKHAFRSSDTWLRLNQDGAFTNGTHTPGLFAPMSLNVGGAIGWGNPGNGDAIIAGNLGTHGYHPKPRTNGWGGGIHTWDVEAEGTVWSRNGYQTGPRDLAENYLAMVELEAGDVVALDPGADRIVRCKSANDPMLLGVVSTQPGFLLNVDHDLAEGRHYPIALCGRVPCKVVAENGFIQRGDLLTSSSTPGHAMRATPIEIGGMAFYRPGTIIGKALDPLATEQGVIDVFVFSS